MTDTIRYIPRYIRNTDAFGWQGADSPDGPWRSIAPPQSSAPWQTTSPMDALPQTSAEVSGAKMLSPAAQAVLDAANGRSSYGPDDCLNESRWIIAAALRAAADQVVPGDGSRRANEIRFEFLAIATELENQ